MYCWSIYYEKALLIWGGGGLLFAHSSDINRTYNPRSPVKWWLHAPQIIKSSESLLPEGVYPHTQDEFNLYNF